MEKLKSLAPTAENAEFHQKIQRVRRTSLGENIVRQIMTLISTGDLKPGQQLPSERELCTYFGVGRSSLREAVSCLSMIGILDVSVGNGTYLATSADRFVEKIFEWRTLTERHKLDNLIEVRQALECAAAARAAVHGTSQQFEQLEAILKKMVNSAKQAKTFTKYDFEFHVELAKASGNSLLYDLLYMIRSQLSAVIFAFGAVPGGPTRACEHHALILKALKRRDPNEARLAMENHLAIGLERYRAAEGNLAAIPSIDLESAARKSHAKTADSER